MKTQNVRPYSTSFGRLNLKSEDMSDKLIKTINNSKAFKKFGRRYDATISLEYFQSSKDPKKIYYGITLDSIKPSNIFYKLLNSLFSRKNYKSLITYNSHKETEDGLIYVINKMNKNFLVDRF